MKKEKVRERIIRVASDLFYKQGYNSTGINQIIAEADIVIGSLYNHFSSKNDLLQAYLIKEEMLPSGEKKIIVKHKKTGSIEKR